MTNNDLKLGQILFKLPLWQREWLKNNTANMSVFVREAISAKIVLAEAGKQASAILAKSKIN